MLGCSQEVEKESEAPASAERTIAEVNPDLPRPLVMPVEVEKPKEVKLPEPPQSQEGGIETTEVRLEKERAWAIELEKVNNERMAKKLGVSVEEYENLTIEEQKELIRKHRGRK